MKGFSLIELMLVLALSLTLSLLMGHLYWTYQQNFDYQKTYMEASENAVLANFYLREIIEQAGYIGCLSLKNAHVINHTKHIIKSFEVSADKQSLTVNNLSPQSNYLLEDNHSPNYLLVNKSPLLHKGDTVMVSNCENVEIFNIDNVTMKAEGQLLYTQQNISLYHGGDFLGAWLETALFTAKTARKTSQGLPIYALYLQQNNQKEELLENINNLHFQITPQVDSSYTLIKISFQETTSLKTWQFNEYLKI